MKKNIFIFIMRICLSFPVLHLLGCTADDAGTPPPTENHQEASHDKDEEARLWFEYLLATMNEPPIHCLGEKSYRLTVMGGMGMPTYILGLSDLGDEYVIYHKIVATTLSTFESVGYRTPKAEMDSLLLLKLDELADEMYVDTSQNKTFFDGLAATLEINTYSKEKSVFIQAEVFKEDMKTIKAIYSMTSFAMPPFISIASPRAMPPRQTKE